MNALELSRSLGNFVAITKSRLAGKSYVPHPPKRAYLLKRWVGAIWPVVFAPMQKQPQRVYDK